MPNCRLRLVSVIDKLMIPWYLVLLYVFNLGSTVSFT